MAYASQLESNGTPIEVSAEKKNSSSGSAPATAPTQAPAATPAPSFVWGATAVGATPSAVAPQAQPVLNKMCEFETIVYNPSSSYRQKPYVRPPHVGYRRWLQVKCSIEVFAIVRLRCIHRARFSYFRLIGKTQILRT